MNGDVTVRDVMTRDFVGVSECDTVAGVADLMVEAGVAGAVVLRGSDPVGMIDARDVVALVAADGDPGSVTARQAMSDSVAAIDADGSLWEAVSTFAGSDSRRLVVVDGEDVLGTLSEHDVIAAQSVIPDAESAELPNVPLAAGATETAGDDRFSTQSVCEACGSLAGSLTSVNGQLLCVDCREM